MPPCEIFIYIVSQPTFAQEAKAGWTYIRIAIFTPVKFLLCANHFPVQLQVPIFVGVM
ncbi:hypothetical protein DAI22_09g052000 [Oryza sativa Japonica Group]|nr:hypothetical protein DAI22_09g052000 [Oryza sativa Japonica Group]